MLGCAAAAGWAQSDSIGAAREAELVRFVRQDCGSCHGLTLRGGLGPPLTAQALAGRPPEALARSILEGHAGTAMPPWKALLSAPEARWIAERLLAGFPPLKKGGER